MEKRKLICLILVMGFVLIISNSCKKDKTPTPIVNQTVTDIDGNVYHTVTLGTQTWMVENLKTTKYRNGDAIPNVTDSTTWIKLSTGAYCDYNNDAKNVAVYGRLYNWFAVKTGNLCPTGWHVPSDAEWSTLIDWYIGGNGNGGKLKEAGTSHWNSPNTAATNETGFTALPGGFRYNYINGAFSDIGKLGFWWSSTEFDSFYAWHTVMFYNDQFARRENYYKTDGNSVRCIKD